ncbi:hypothetical protein ACFXG6_17120 [Streptomyces roseus]|uniref:hypothetical protein n=1 Tax=Streptomyces roseus TaxID=66430 RepID=UPI0036C6FAD7
MTDHPWDSYTRDRLHAGFSYPVGRSLIEGPLRTTGLHLHSLHLSCPLPREWEQQGGLLFARWFAAGGTPGLASLYVGAVPSHQRALVGGLLRDDLLERACGWLHRLAADPVSGYAMSSRDWRARLHEGEVIVQESQH